MHKDAHGNYKNARPWPSSLRHQLLFFHGVTDHLRAWIDALQRENVCNIWEKCF